MKKGINYEYYDEILTRNLKEKLVRERREELKILIKRVKQLEMELEGMGQVIEKGSYEYKS